MAKWGEGDPRWIVEERPDATNVNNWHWTEKNAQIWSKEKLQSLLLDFPLDTNAGQCKITEIEKCEGDASANNRKAKIIIFYEWNLKLKWKGKVFGVDKEITGTIKIPNLSDENDVDDLDIQFSVDKSGPEEQKLKEALRVTGVKLMKSRMQEYIDSLQSEFTQGMILPKKDGILPASNNKLTKLSTGINKCSINPNPPGTKPSKPKSALKTVTSTTSMKCKAEELYRALTNEYEFKIFTNGSGTIDPKVGGTFEMFGGNVHGKILELEPNTKIVQDWRFKHWPEGHFSKVNIVLEQKESSTNVTVTQTGVPEEDCDKTKDGWDIYYWDAMKRTLGFGSFLH